MQPRLSVVVPFRNAEQHLTACLESIAGQTLSCLQAVLVDDGSTDDSPTIAQDFAARDPRFRYVRRTRPAPRRRRTAAARRPDAWQGAARNHGVAKTPRDVEFLAFADADDVLPHDAYARLIARLDTTASAFATGNVWRLGPHGRHQDPAYHWLTEPRARTHVTRDPRLLADRSVRNKVFRRAFWDRHALSFPEGRRYGSAWIAVPAHVLAGAVDVLPEHVSYQRIRRGPGTLPPGTDARAARDRVAACDHVSRFLAVQQPAHRTAYDITCLREDLVPFLWALPAGSAAYRATFLAEAADFVSRVSPEAFDALPPILRTAWQLVRDAPRRPDALLELLTAGPGEPSVAAPEAARGRRPGAGLGLRLGLGGRRGTAADKAVRPGRTGPSAVALVHGIAWHPDGRLRITGHVHVPGAAAGPPRLSARAGVLVSAPEPGWDGPRRLPGMDGARRAGLRAAGGLRRVRRVPARAGAAPNTPDASATPAAPRPHDHGRAGFEITVDPARLRVKGAWRPGDWLLGVLVAGHGTVRHALVRAVDAGDARSVVRDLGGPEQDAGTGPDGGRLRLEVGYDADLRLRLSVVEHPVVVDRHHREGDDLVLSGRGVVGGSGDADAAVARSGTAGGPAGAPWTLRLTRPHTEGDSGTTSAGGVGIVIEAPLTRADPDGDGDRFEVRVPLSRLADIPPAVHRAPREVPPPYAEPWHAELVLADGTRTRPAAVPALPPGRYVLDDGRELCATADDRGRLRIELTARPIATSVTWADDGTLTVAGTLGAAPLGTPGTPASCSRAARPGHAELVLRHARLGAEVSAPLVRGDGPAFTATLAPGGGTLREGRWYAYVREYGGEEGGGTHPASEGEGHSEEDGGPKGGGRPEGGPTTGRHAGARVTETPLRALAPLAAALPARHTAQGRPFAVDRRHGDHLVVEAGSVLSPADRAPYRQRLLRSTHYPRQRTEPLRNAVLYTAGRGDDSPRAVHEELVRRGTDTEHLWVTRDEQIPVPPLAHPVEEHSTAWYEALARCRWIVASDHLPPWFVRRPDQTVVQTWHGVPLRRIGTDLEGTRHAHHGALEALPRQSAQWSVLVSPNRFATRHLCRALGYEGELLQAGSPRNDVLFSPDRDKIADRVRRELDLPDDRRVVLYAPTYREHLGHTPCGGCGDPAGRSGGYGAAPAAYGAFGACDTCGAGGGPDAPPCSTDGYGAGYVPYAFEPTLDLRALEAALGADHVLLLRRHPLTAGRTAGARAPFVRDVTRYPHAAALMLVADVLVTDYSSLMFDFAHTGRPMLFLTPDLAYYRDPAVRGFTLDFERRAPGPLLTSTGDVLAALTDLDAVAARHADAYAAFREAYCDLDDGRAAARVADRLLR